MHLNKLCFVLPEYSGGLGPPELSGIIDGRGIGEDRRREKEGKIQKSLGSKASGQKQGTISEESPRANERPENAERQLQTDGKSERSRGCGGQVFDFVEDLIHRMYKSNWVNPCFRGTKRGVLENKPFQDMEGVQMSGKLGCENARIFGYSELYIGSNGFSGDQILGSGGFGRVYKAVLPSDGTTVAVKCLADKKGEHFEKAFASELVAVAQLRHRNLVKLRGWCVHDDELLLVYDFMPNRSLDRVLFQNAAKSAVGPLSWERRTKIVRGLAAALFYLHEQLETQIIHRDVKTSNVMLDSNFNARLGDFGLARWLEHEIECVTSNDSMSLSFQNHRFRVTESTRIGGTIGYLPPESFRKGIATAKTDVFSFGVVLLEVVSGRRAVDLTYADDKIVLLDWVRRLYDEGRVLDAGDSRLGDASYKLNDMERLIHIALLCTLHKPQLRPNMKWVRAALSGDISGKLPDLPSFRGHPLYIAVSSLSTTSQSQTATTTTTTVGRTTTTGGSTKSNIITSGDTSAASVALTNYKTAFEESIYVTADFVQGSDSSSSFNLYNSSRRSNGEIVVETPREISYKEIISATDNFSERRRVAEVDFGTGYRGVLNAGQHVLVKRLGMTKCPALVTRFSTELQNLGRLRHRNLIQLRGWCTEQGEMLVVYDYSAKRILSHVLFHNTTRILEWRFRYNIVKSLACAIRYLHEEWDEQVIHRNITSSTVILDNETNPRLCGFALAEFLTRNDHAHPKKKSPVCGIFGYMSPEYMELGEATTMADVYSFGVVVLEIVTGQSAVDLRRPDVDALLVMRVQKATAERQTPADSLVDSRLDGDYNQKDMMRLLKLGIMCTRSDPELRPNMREVISILEGNENLIKEGRKESVTDYKQTYVSSLSMIRRMQALGVH